MIEIGKLYQMVGPDFSKTEFNPRNTGHNNWKKHLERVASSLLCMPIAIREEDEWINGVKGKTTVALCYLVGWVSKDKPLINGKDIDFLGIPLGWLTPVAEDNLGGNWISYGMPSGQFVAEDGFQKKKLAELLNKIGSSTVKEE